MSSWNFHNQVLTGTDTMMTGGAYMPSYKLYYLLVSQDSIDAFVSVIKKMTKGDDIS